MKTYQELPKTQLYGTLAGLMLTLLLAALDQTIVGTAMPRIIAQLDGFERYAWVTTAYLLTSTIAVPVAGKLSDMYGRKFFLVAGSGAFVAFSALCGAAGDLPAFLGDGMNQLILFRALQGLAGGMVMGMVFTVIGDLFPPAVRGRYQGLFSGIWGIASVLGPTLGGWITDHYSWRWVFYVNLPVGLLALTALVVAFPHVEAPPRSGRVDYAGIFTLVGWIVPLLLALTFVTELGWTHPLILGMLIGAAAMLALFLVVEAKAQNAILPLTLFRNRVFAVSAVVVFLVSVCMFGAMMFVPLFMQAVLGVSATSSGNLLTPLMLMVVAGSIVSGQLVSRLGSYKIFSVVGLAVMVGGMVLMAHMGLDTTRWEVIRNMMTLGAGLGLTMPLYTLIVQNSVDRSQMGVATAATQFFRSIGGTVGAAVLGTVMLTQYRAHVPNGDSNPLRLVQSMQSLSAADLAGIKLALVSSLDSVFWIGAVLALVAFLVNLGLEDRPLRHSHAPIGSEAVAVPAH